jgi:predicted adenine nucleotide alpha hydrolase (AANH) superfamily ATPase
MNKCLLHVCCAPCSIAVIDELKDLYDLTVYFYNPNIYPEVEYLKRKAEVVRMIEGFNNGVIASPQGETIPQNSESSGIATSSTSRRTPRNDNSCHPELVSGSPCIVEIKFVDADYETEKWDKHIAGLENEPEGGARCASCFAMRLQKSGEYASKNSFDIFATTLTSGRNKKADVIHPLGSAIAKKFGLKFLDIDWKKGGRQEKGRRMVKDRGIYRQEYCGCKYSVKISNVKLPISNQ